MHKSGMAAIFASLMLSFAAACGTAGETRTVGEDEIPEAWLRSTVGEGWPARAASP
ncbi:MAG: hypothetical protein R3F20_13355 [Planctomycetota bacterium]